jgi:hypothetical protein
MKNEISFVKVNILEHWRWWNNYCSSHTAQEVKEELMAQANALLAMDLNSNERAKQLLEEAISFSQKKRDAGRLGGLAKSQNKMTKPKTKPPTKDEIYDFAEEQFIDDGIARQFWEICESRNWCDKNGKKIVNWKGALINFSKRMSNDSE